MSASNSNSYQWQVSSDSSTFTNISGATGQNYQPGALYAKTYYRRQTTCNSDVGYTLNTATVDVSPPAFIPGTISAHTSYINYNGFVPGLTLSGTANGSCGGSYTYAWQYSTNGTSWSYILDEDSTVYPSAVITRLTTTTYYRVEVSCSGETKYSDTATINVYPQVQGGTISPSTQTIDYNANASQLSVSGVSGGTGTYTYQWRSSPNNSSWTDVSGATTATYTPTGVTGTTYYKVVVTSNGASASSSSAVVNIHLEPGSISPTSAAIDYDSSPGQLTGTSGAAGNCGGSYVYQWQSSTNGTTFSDISGATAQHYTPNNLTQNTWFRRKVTCSSEVGYTNVCAVTVDANKNYVKVREITKPEVTNISDASLLSDVKEVKQATQYFDGLGRPEQTVIKQGSLDISGTPYDLVSPVAYDAFGRETYKYLPFVANTTGGNTSLYDGLFKTNPLQQDSVFNKNLFDDNYFYGRVRFEPSPMNRVVETFAAGNSWAGTYSQTNENDRRSVKTKFWSNVTADSVRIWTLTDVANSFGTYSTSTMYAAGTLYKTVVADEANNQVVEFKDKGGKVILKKVQLTAAADTGTGKGYYGWLCTYYIYDDIGNLRCVIQPKGVELLAANSWDLSYSGGVILNEQSFRYEYDEKGRMIMKKVPGAGVVRMVYDARDRMVLTQDSLMRAAHQWLYTEHDALNRPIATGIFTDNDNYNNLNYHSSRADTSISYPYPGTYTVDTLTKTFFDDYCWRAGQGNPLSGFLNTSNDSYLQTASNTIWPYPQDVAAQTSQVKGMATGTKVKVLGSSNNLYSVSFYDDKARLIQTQSTNVSGGTDIITNQYSWTGQLLLNIAENDKDGSNPQTSVIVTQITYDKLQRITKVEKKVSNSKVEDGEMPGTWKTIAQNEYDALGQLKKKKLGDAPLDSLSYDYNIRGWMMGMNRNYVKDTTSTTNWFGFDLGYDQTSFTVNGSSKSYTSAQYNGNINGMLWRSTGDDMLRKYDFTYDAANRLTGADFNQLNSNSFSKAAGVDFSVTGLSYDANGNIFTMFQKGWKLGGSLMIDSMLYTYYSNSNKLKNVLDYKNDTVTKLGDFRSSKTYMDALSNNKTTSATDYNYDVNGNLVADNNKDISYIHYNYLNLPDSIVVSGKGNIKYIYDATGVKLKKITTEGSKITTTLYMFGNFVNDTLQFLPQEEGRIRFNTADTTLTYDYFIKDHLGNIRMVLTEQEQTDAYPVASLETALINTEKSFYAGLDTGRVNKNTVSDYPVDEYTDPNDFVQKLSGDGAKVGASIVLKVMAGDKFSLRVNSWWKSGDSPDAPANPITDLVSAISGGVGGLGSGVHGTAQQITSSGVLSPNVTSFLNSHSGYDSDKPKAFVNWILFDEQFNYVNSSSGFEQVGGSNTLTPHTRTDLTLAKSGYLYIYVSNETPNINVFFDNLQVTHIRGPLIEETHYYPFGLTMAGISSNAVNFGTPNNKYKFNSIEQNNDFDLNMYDARYRNLDPQIGKFWQIDPKPNETFSLYAAMANNPILYSDPLGDTTWVYGNTGRFLGVVNDNLANQVHFLNREGGTKPFDVSNLSMEASIKLGQSFRDESVAFMGSNTLSDMKSLKDAAVKDNKEILFTGTVGKDKEIRLSAVKTDKGEYARMENVDKILDQRFTKEQQANMFLIGHVHQQTAVDAKFTQERDLLYQFGLPSNPNVESAGDYGPYLYRSTNATARGQSPALILNRWGFSVYGTASSSKPGRGLNSFTTEGRVVPGNESYFLYKQLKK